MGAWNGARHRTEVPELIILAARVVRWGACRLAGVQLEHAPKSQYHWAIAPPVLIRRGALSSAVYVQRRREKRVVPQTAIKPRSSRVPVVRGAA